MSRALPRIRDVVSAGAPLLVDIWGVVHDGTAAYADAIEGINAASINHPIVFLTNASYRRARLVSDLAQMGIAPDRYLGVLSAADATLDLLTHPDMDVGRRFFLIGADENSRVMRNTRFERASTIAEASFIVLTDAADIESRDLQEALVRGVPLVCLNADLSFVDRGGTATACAGAVAEAYLARGGRVIKCGKPDADFYRLAQQRFDLGGTPVCIGDSVRTDLAGAAAMGWPSIWIRRPEHGPGEPTLLSELTMSPLAIHRSFRW